MRHSVFGMAGIFRNFMESLPQFIIIWISSQKKSQMTHSTKRHTWCLVKKEQFILTDPYKSKNPTNHEKSLLTSWHLDLGSTRSERNHFMWKYSIMMTSVSVPKALKNTIFLYSKPKIFKVWMNNNARLISLFQLEGGISSDRAAFFNIWGVRRHTRLAK